MAQTWTCTEGDDDPAVVLITDCETGAVTSPCLAHWVALCCSVAEAAGWVRGPDDTLSVSPPAEDAPDGVPAAIPRRRRTSEPAQRARTRRELAARPDAAATSEQVTGPLPGARP